MQVTSLAGGVGGAKLLVGLEQAVAPNDLTAVVNTGDDASCYGVYVAPDLDIVTYWLAGIADSEKGWGIAGDTYRVLGALERLGADTWFRLGDKDLATCIYRTERLRAGSTLSAVTEDIGRALGVRCRLLPMSDDAVRTQVITADGRTLGFQEYFVRERTAPEVAALEFVGAEDAKPAPGVLEAIERADTVIVCPSNPLLSIGPILALAELRAALAAHPRVIAVTPILQGVALKGPADKLLASLVGEASASAVARLYADFCDVFVVDASDAEELRRVQELGLRGVALDTVMNDAAASERLARALLAL